MPGAPNIHWGKAVTWGAYLACSWTWCIGMFLPLLLVRDHGPGGWWAFAIPNVLGAAAMGWALRSSLSAARVRAGHLAVGRAFSLVTIAFHSFFIAWMGGTLFPAEVLPVVVLLVGVVMTACVLLGSGVRWLAVLVWLASAGVLGVVLAQAPGSIGATLGARGELPATDVLWLAPVCVLGFALCPYLDLTFLRARRVCDGPTGPAAFSLGFVLLFASMIVLTLAYAPMFGADLLALGLLDRPTWVLLCMGHVALQSAFTIGVHVVELATPEPPPRLAAAGPGTGHAPADDWPTGTPTDALPPRPMRLGRLLLLLSMLWAGALGAASQAWPPLGSMPAGEVAYRVFMSAYGLVFPAYVWICMIPHVRSGTPRPGDRDDRITRPTRRCLLVWAAAVLIASPFYALGFLWRETVWLAPGVLIVLLARLGVPRATPAR